jgi:hypothetical protein
MTLAKLVAKLQTIANRNIEKTKNSAESKTAKASSLADGISHSQPRLYHKIQTHLLASIYCLLLMWHHIY